MNDQATWYALWTLMGVNPDFALTGNFLWMQPSTAKMLVRHMNGRETRFRPLTGKDGAPPVESLYDDKIVRPLRWYLLRDFKNTPVAWAYMDAATRNRLEHFIQKPVRYPQEQIVFTSPTSAVAV